MSRSPLPSWRKHRIGELGAASAGVLVAEFESDFFGSPGREPRFAGVAVDIELLDDAARLTGVHGLRAYGAIQLASARTVARVDPDFGGFAAFDRTLCAAASTEGFAVLP